MSHKQKRVSYEELKDHFIQMQIKLNQVSFTFRGLGYVKLFRLNLYGFYFS